MYLLPKTMKHPTTLKSEIIEFRQFETVEEAIAYYDETWLLLVINKHLIDDDRKMLRSLMTGELDAEVAHYRKHHNFVFSKK